MRGSPKDHYESYDEYEQHGLDRSCRWSGCENLSHEILHEMKHDRREHAPPSIIVNPGVQYGRDDDTSRKRKQVGGTAHCIVVTGHYKQWRVPNQPHDTNQNARRHRSPSELESIEEESPPADLLRHGTEEKDNYRRDQERYRASEQLAGLTGINSLSCHS